MSGRKRALAELPQAQVTPSRRGLSTPHGLGVVHQRSARSARSIRHVDANSVRPDSARGILRRLAKVTAPTTKRRIASPAIAHHDKENYGPPDDGEVDEEDLKQPTLNFQIEESIEEEDSEIPVAPTPSALLEDTDDDDDDDDEQPAVTHQNSRPPFDSALSEENADDDEEQDGNSTFLTERGRRAVSEEPTKMSRYSFGSIRMSEFASELEIRRESDRQQKLVALEAEDNHGGIETDLDDDGVNLGGGTEELSTVDDDDAGSFHMPDTDNDTLQADILDVVEEDVNASQQAEPRTSSSRRQTLLESVTAKAVHRPRKKLKMNQRGNMVPSLPSSLLKRIVHDSQEKAKKPKTALGKDHMKALEQATEWFFEQVGEDLEAYSEHGKRKKRINSDDVLLLMRRQRVLRTDGELRKLAKDWLPSSGLPLFTRPHPPSNV